MCELKGVVSDLCVQFLKNEASTCKVLGREEK